MEFKRYRIEEIGTVVGGGTPSTKNPNYYGGNIPWITPKDLANYEKRYIQYGERNITDEGLKHSSAKLVPANTILMTSRAPIGYLAIAANEVSTNQGFKSIICDEKVVSPKFLYYLLQYEMENIKSLGTGSTFSEISGKVVKNIEVNLPNIENQKKIEGVLDVVDEKIETNQHIIANLEELSQTLFKHWFVDFEFPDKDGNPYKSSGGEMIDSEIGEIPKGWEISKLDKIINIKSGKRPRNKVNIMDNKNKTPIIGASKIMGYTSDYLESEPILVMGRVGTHGVIQRFNNNVWPSDNTFIIKSKFMIYSYFILINIDYKSLNRGSTQPLLSQKDIKNINIIIPKSDSLIVKYEEITNIYFKEIDVIRDQISYLIELRDTLLSKLMSGELEIPDDIEVNSDELSI
ncbi:type I restriction enzyme S subunit [Staphylococcus hominis]|uniref:restriction endonuclease subunit S n=1 Tax=Staphylococcus hominis TaxID=1290 RepID=UPI00160CA229|nr:restriction endonuclease subunit S [Staphylococcus hominis]MBB4833521.1 type I restriction enzyme S subunit [Staphylococcus hominis]